MERPPFIPEYNKPEEPGAWMQFDNTIALYHVVYAHEPFEKAAQDVFKLVLQAQERFPDWPRALYLDIEGHRNAAGHFEDEFVEFQQEFWFSTIAPFLTSFTLPLTGGLVNPAAQRNDLPDVLVIRQDF